MLHKSPDADSRSLNGLRLFLHVEADVEGAARRAAEIVAARCAEAVARRGVFTLALSGGSTPLPLFRLLRTQAWQDRVDWAHTRVFWVDERCVPADDPASNYGVANRELLAHVPAAAIFPMDCLSDPGEAAVAYEETLRQHVPAENGGPRLDCALLGMGADGHTASLFPGSPLLQPEALSSGRLTGAAVAEGMEPKPESRRITLTLPMLNASRCCLFLGTGAEKGRACGRRLISSPPPSCPCSACAPWRAILSGPPTRRLARRSQASEKGRARRQGVKGKEIMKRTFNPDRVQYIVP